MNSTQYIYGNTIKIAIVSDVHNTDYKPIVDNLVLNKPDLIFIPGDVVYGDIPVNQTKLEQSTNSYMLLKECSQIAPSFLSLGNHEWVLMEEDYKVLKELGLTILDNTYIKYKNLVIGGLTSFKVLDYRKTHQIKATSRIKRVLSNDKNHYIDTNWLSSFEKEEGIKILLSHHPEDFDILKKYKIDYIISGHAHGGQWRYYSLLNREWKGLFAPDQGLFPIYSKGIYQGEHGIMIVSAGLSNTVLPIPRLCNPEEIVYLTI